MKKSNHLVIGTGQIGSALMNILKSAYTVYGIDKNDLNDPVGSDNLLYSTFDVLHITFPYFPGFVDEVIRYQRIFGTPHTLTIIHSTVDKGTTKKIPNAVHSPVRGIHPNLEEGILTFPKFIGGLRSEEAKVYFTNLGIKCITTPNSDETEAMKLWDTTIYGWNIILEKAIHQYCEENGLNFELVYTEACKTYNDGYEKLGHPEYKKYILKHYPGKIGGHCVMQNCAILKNPITDFIVEQDKLFS